MVLLKSFQARWMFAVCTLMFAVGTQADFSMRHVSTVYLPHNAAQGPSSYALDSSAVEQFSFDPEENLIYAASREILHVVNVSDPTSMTRLLSINMPSSDLTDVEFCGDYIFLANNNLANRREGSMMVYRKFNGTGLEFVREVIIGVFPDMLYVMPGCRKVLIALEAEPYVNGAVFENPRGAVIVVEFPDGVERTARVKTVGFENFNDRYDQLSNTGFRAPYMPQGSTIDMDIEPEYIAVDMEANKAFVSLQENNAVAVMDLTSDNISDIIGLGFKQWESLDASDRDNGIEITYWPIKGMYQPDALVFHSWQGRKLVFTANEGDSKEYDFVNFDDSVRGANINTSMLDDSIPEFVRTALRQESQLGRLKFSNADGRYANGTYHTLHSFGARSFSIWDAADNFRLVYDSGSHIEKATAIHCPHLFNRDDDDVDARSDDKGPESESIAVGELEGRLYIFIGNERPGSISVYSLGKDVTQPRFEQIFCDGIPSGKTLSELYNDREIYAADPEDMRFYPASQSPTGTPVLMVAGAYSGTISILEITATPDPVSPNTPGDGDNHCGGDGASAIGSSLVLLITSAVLSYNSVFRTT